MSTARQDTEVWTGSVWRLPLAIDHPEAEQRVLRRLPGAQCVESRLLHHPYGGFAFHLEQRPLGRRLHGDLHVLVDLRGGATATTDPWPTPVGACGHDLLEGPPPVVSADEALRNARQCLMRTALHRRLSLRHPRIEVRDMLLPLYKPNWLLVLKTARSQESMRILVDGLTGGYHLVTPRVPSGPGHNPGHVTHGLDKEQTR